MGDDAELYMETGGEPSILCDNEDDFSYTEEESIDFTSISSECKRCFFVDYENVNRVGLNGILKLSETDCVRIYYSKNADANKKCRRLSDSVSFAKSHKTAKGYALLHCF